MLSEHRAFTAHTTCLIPGNGSTEDLNSISAINRQELNVLCGLCKYPKTWQGKASAESVENQMASFGPVKTIAENVSTGLKAQPPAVHQIQHSRCAQVNWVNTTNFSNFYMTVDIGGTVFHVMYNHLAIAACGESCLKCHNTQSMTMKHGDMHSTMNWQAANKPH